MRVPWGEDTACARLRERSRSGGGLTQEDELPRAGRSPGLDCRMAGLIEDPYAASDARDPRGGRAKSLAGAPFRVALLAIGALAVLLLAGLAVAALFFGLRFSTPKPESVVSTRPSPAILVAIRDMARLETTEVHVEKVVDLTDTQSRFFGLIQATDALLLVAVGHVVIGVDLSRLTEGDLSMDPETGVARIELPEPEVFSTRLDEKETYVYTRTTSLMAKRNEHLETRARQEAIRAIEKAAVEGDLMMRAKAQAERQLGALATQLGAKRVEFRWRAGTGR